jgi:hypothetical protein
MKAVLCPAVLLLVAGGWGGGGAEAGLLGAGTGEGSCAAPPFRKIPVYCNSVHTRMQLCMLHTDQQKEGERPFYPIVSV